MESGQITIEIRLLSPLVSPPPPTPYPRPPQKTHKDVYYTGCACNTRCKSINNNTPKLNNKAVIKSIILGTAHQPSFSK